MFNGKKILITGGTGSLGSALTERLLKTDVDTIRIFSRDEWKQTNLENRLNDKRLRFFIGDVRDKERLYRALEGNIDIVIHTAALKQVPVAEYNPFEAVKTNVYGAQNLIEACLDKNIKIALAIGTDKAVSPVNTYGATKFLMEKLFVASNYYGGPHITKFFSVRYGNVLGSRGSVVPLFIEQIRKGKKITVTDPSMTRFNITMENALDLIFRALEKGKGRETFIPKLKAYKLGDMKDAIIELLDGKNEIEKVPIRPGEKFHESLINIHEIRDAYDDGEDYVLFDKQSKFLRKEDIPDIKKANLNTEYSSDKVELLSVEEIKKILLNEKIIQN